MKRKLWKSIEFNEGKEMEEEKSLRIISDE